jgi:hypothetical protein
MGDVLPLFKDRREAPRVQTKREVREHLDTSHGHVVSERMHFNDMHDIHDSLHTMVSSHSHEAS